MSYKEETTKHTLHLYTGDYARMQDLHPNLSAALVIRTLVRRHIESIEAQLPVPSVPEIRTEAL